MKKNTFKLYMVILLLFINQITMERKPWAYPGIHLVRLKSTTYISCYMGISPLNGEYYLEYVYHQTRQCVDEIETCIEESKKRCFLQRFDNIFIKIFYNNIYGHSWDTLETRDTVKQDKTALSKIIPSFGSKNFEILDSHSQGLYNYLDHSFSFLNKEPNLSIFICINNDFFYIGFLPKYHDFYDNYYITKFAFKGKHYIAFANSFYCNKLRDLQILTFQKIFSKYKEKGETDYNTIPNPCIPYGINVTYNEFTLQSQCSPDFVLGMHKVQFVGIFNKKLCAIIFNSILYDNDFCTLQKGCNLAEIYNRKIVTTSKKVELVTKYLLNTIVTHEELISDISKKLNNHCKNNIRSTDDASARDIINECFHMILLDQLFVKDKLLKPDMIIDVYNYRKGLSYDQFYLHGNHQLKASILEINNNSKNVISNKIIAGSISYLVFTNDKTISLLKAEISLTITIIIFNILLVIKLVTILKDFRLRRRL